jgi:hypothetical protein
VNLPNKKKIINDPVYGFVNIPFELIYDLIEHSWFQRLRRIKQLGLSYLVYPGAQHTRFQHVIGAMSLTFQAVEILKWLKNLRREIESQAKTYPIQASYISSINAKIDNTESFLEKAATNEIVDRYKSTFQWLLSINGASYDAAKDQFKPKRWDVARFFDKFKLRAVRPRPGLQARLPHEQR